MDEKVKNSRETWNHMTDLNSRTFLIINLGRFRPPERSFVESGRVSSECEKRFYSHWTCLQRENIQELQLFHEGVSKVSERA